MASATRTSTTAESSARVTIGQGSEAGDGSAYSDPSGVFGIGHGQEKGSAGAKDRTGAYFGSLDAGTRTNMIRYDTPSIGPLSAAVSIGNGDRVSAKLALGTEFNGTSFSAQVATLQEKGDSSTVGASFGASMASGFTVSGAWAKGESMGGSAAKAGEMMEGCFDDSGEMKDAEEIGTDTGVMGCNTNDRIGQYMSEGTDAMMGTDPSYFQASIGYKFGNTAVAASWYSSEDFKMMGSEGTAIGIGVNHNLPKVGAQVYAAVQNYDVNMGGDDGSMMDMMDDTVFVVGTRVKF